jgi:hypothetical protein
MFNQNSFRDSTGTAGISWSRQKGDEAFSVNWTDFNGDGRYDLWISGHGYNGRNQAFAAKYPFLYTNNGNATFTNRFPNDFRQGSGGDTHGTTWGDLDNDGDSDVLVSAGGQLGQGGGQPNILFINNNGSLQNEAAAKGIQYPEGRGRSSLFFDQNNDGRLDVLLLEGLRTDGLGKVALFRQQTDGNFSNVTDEVGLANGATRYAQLGDLTGDGKTDLLIQGTYQFPFRAYDYSSGSSLVDITNLFPKISDPPPVVGEDFDFADHDSVRDSVIADFNNDGRNEIFGVRSNIGFLGSSVFQGDAKTLAGAELTIGNSGGEIGFNFKTTGNVTFDLFDLFGREVFTDSSDPFSTSQIFLGGGGRNPTAAELAAISSSCNLGCGCSVCSQATNTTGAGFTLSTTSAGINGLKGNRSQRGIYIGYNTTTQSWQVRLTSPAAAANIRAAVESSSDITNLTRVNFPAINPDNNGLAPIYWVFNPSTGRYENRASQSGLGSPTLGQSVVSGDFDNDKDLDIYIEQAYSTYNRPNILYENLGNGTFRRIGQAGGAAGRQNGIHFLDFEVGPRVAVADYDNNGFLDIFNGSQTVKSPRKTYLGTPSQLFQNQGNSNNWLEIDLQGTTSNRDGVGARVSLTSGGTTQIREQNTGIHAFAQNAQRLHFGLGGDTNITRLVVSWPSGTQQTFTNLGVNNIIRINESNGISNVARSNLNNTTDDVANADRSSTLNIEANTINSKRGNDNLTGTDLSDRFVFDRLTDGNDTIANFNSESDILVFSASGFGGDLEEEAILREEAFVLGSRAGDSSDRFIYDEATGQLFFDPDGNARKAQIAIASFIETPTLSNTNIEISA